MTLRASTNASMRTWRRFFPLVSVESVTDLLEEMLQLNDISSDSQPTIPEPNLAFISIILGFIETQLTTVSALDSTNTLKHKTVSEGVHVQPRKRPDLEKSLRTRRSKGRSSSPVVKAEYLSADALSAVNECSLTPNSSSRLSGASSPSCGFICATPLSETSGIFASDWMRKELPTAEKPDDTSASDTDSSQFPIVRFEEAERLYQIFYSMITKNFKLNSSGQHLRTESTSQPKKASKSFDVDQDTQITASRDLICAVCKILCSHLASSRQREHVAHAQSIYSFLKSGSLDSFGMAFTTVAACQLLGYNDVHLALSEDHAWVEFGPEGHREAADVAVMPTVEPITTASDEVTLLGSDLNMAVSIISDSPSNIHPPPVRIGHLQNSWLFVNGFPVVCNPNVVSVAAAVTAIQPCGLSKSVQLINTSQHATVASPVSPYSEGSIRPSGSKRNRAKASMQRSTGDGISSQRSSAHCVEVVSPLLVRLKQSLLWVVFKAGLLTRYPLGLTNLADIEEGYPSVSELPDINGPYSSIVASKAPYQIYPLDDIIEIHDPGDKQSVLSPGFHFSGLRVNTTVHLDLLLQAIEINRAYYYNQHVYPYIYLANHLHRHGDFAGALGYWAEATRVIGQYNHSSEDAEIYREFLDIATRVMPELFKSVAVENRTCCESTLAANPVYGVRQSGNILDSPICLAYLLAFYDRLCLWEENSAVPVLHVGWVDKLMVSLTRFSVHARRHLTLKATRQIPDKTHSPLVASRSSARASALRHQHSTRFVSEMPRREPPSPLVLDRGNISVLGSLEDKQLDHSTQPLTVLLPFTPAISCHGHEPQISPALMMSSTSSSAASMITAATASHPTTDDIDGHIPLKDAIKMFEYNSDRARESLQTKHIDRLPMDVTTGLCKSLAVGHASSQVPTPNGVSSPETTKPDHKEEGFDGLGNTWHSEVLRDLELLKFDLNGPGDTLISQMACLCEHRVLNPAFLLGYNKSAPFLSPTDFENLMQGWAIDLSQTKESSVQTSYRDLMIEKCPESVECVTTASADCLGQSAKTVETAASSTADSSEPRTSFSPLSSCHLSPPPPPSSTADVADGICASGSGFDDINILGFSETEPRPLSSVEFGEELSREREGETVENSPCFESKLIKLSPIPPLGHSINGDATEDTDPLRFTSATPASESQSNKNEAIETAAEKHFESWVRNNRDLSPHQQLISMSDTRDGKADDEGSLVVHLRLLSVKMSSIAGLLGAPGRLNSSAIKLALTAQSQVCMRRRSSSIIAAAPSSAPLPLWKSVATNFVPPPPPGDHATTASLPWFSRTAISPATR